MVTVRECYVRFGHLPKGGKSKNHLTGELEAGVSVFPALEKDGLYYITLPSESMSAWVGLSGCLSEGCAFEVSGEEIGIGSDGEPVLTGVEIVKDITPSR